jgi:glucose-6-phosphate-specific signal transduction histidine kinase
MNGLSRWSVGLRHAAAALGYALGYALIRQLSWSHWVLFAGYRLSVLLLVPYRYWPALAIGELGPVGYTSLSCLETFGGLWSSIMLLSPIALAMPVVQFCRDRLRMIPAGGPVRMGAVLLCTLCTSGLWTLANTAALSVAHVPANTPPIDYGLEISRWIVGNYLGILTVVPLVLMIRGAWLIRSASWRDIATQALRSRLTTETLAYLLPTLVLLTWIALDARSEGARQVAQMLMFVPVLGLALRHGWHGAAIGGTAASIAVVLTMPERYDTTTLQSEVFVAFAATSMLLFGSRIAALHHRVAMRNEHVDRSLALARRIQTQNEAQLSQTAQAIELVSESIHATEEAMFDRLRQWWPAVDVRELRRRTAMTREQLFQLEDGLHPMTLRERGLVASLRYGGIARALDAHRIGYWFQANGDLHALSKPMQLGLHRLICETVSHLFVSHGVSDLALHIRSGRRQGRRCAIIRLDALFSTDPALRVRAGTLVSRLAATGLGLSAIEDRVALFEGKLRVRTTAEGQLISLLLFDPEPMERAVPTTGTAPAHFSCR